MQVQSCVHVDSPKRYFFLKKKLSRLRSAIEIGLALAAAMGMLNRERLPASRSMKRERGPGSTPAPGIFFSNAKDKAAMERFFVWTADHTIQ